MWSEVVDAFGSINVATAVGERVGGVTHVWESGSSGGVGEECEGEADGDC